MSDTAIATITKKDLKAIQKKFKKGYKGYYIPDLLIRMNARRKTLKRNKAFEENSIYNMFNGIYKDQVMLRALFEECLLLYKQYTGEDYVAA